MALIQFVCVSCCIEKQEPTGTTGAFCSATDLGETSSSVHYESSLGRKGQGRGWGGAGGAGLGLVGGGGLLHPRTLLVTLQGKQSG